MIVAVSSIGKSLDAQIDPRFGRCAYFLLVDLHDMSYECYENENGSLSGGAGIQAASFVVSKGAQAVLTGNCGPKAMATFDAAGVRVYTGQSGTVVKAVEHLKAGGLDASFRPTVGVKAGLDPGTMSAGMSPRGTGRCQGGGGRGMGMGMRKAMLGGFSLGAVESADVPPKNNRLVQDKAGKETLAELRKQAAELQKRIEAIQAETDGQA